MQQSLGEKLLLSFDLDVLDPKYYEVGIYTQGSLSPEELSRVTKKIIRGHEVVGVNIAGYRPQAKEVVKQILAPLL